MASFIAKRITGSTLLKRSVIQVMPCEDTAKLVAGPGHSGLALDSAGGRTGLETSIIDEFPLLTFIMARLSCANVSLP
jgi:hypothetical protein